MNKRKQHSIYNNSILSLEFALRKLTEIENEVKNDIILSHDEKIKTQYYLQRVITYLSTKQVNTDKPRKVLGSNNGTIVERLSKYIQWNGSLKFIYNSINWNTNLNYADINMKKLKKLFHQLIQHMNSKSKYLKNELIKLNINNDGQLVCVETDNIVSKMKNLIRYLTDYICRR